MAATSLAGRQSPKAFLESVAVAEGATTPDPGGVSLAWSTTLSAVVRWNGATWNEVGGGAAAGGPTRGQDMAISSGNFLP